MSAKVAETVEGLRRLASFIARGLLAPVGADATIENAKGEKATTHNQESVP